MKILPAPQACPDLTLDVLRYAMSEARKGKYTGVAVAMFSDQFTHTNFAVSEGGSHTELLGTIRQLDDKVLQSWKNSK